MQVNGAQADRFMDFVNTRADDFDDIQDVVNYFLAFLSEAEKDDGLIIARDSIASGIRKAIREGDLTGITLANLAACVDRKFRDTKPIDGGVYELRIAYDPGYRVYYSQRDKEILPLLIDRDKSSQQKDIEKVKKINAEYE